MAYKNRKILDLKASYWKPVSVNTDINELGLSVRI